MNSKTTWAGIATIIGALATTIAYQYDGDPNTVPNWTIVATTAATGIGLIFAKDQNTPKH